VPRRWEAHHDPLETPQCHFTRLVGRFLIWCAQQGYAVALKEVQLTHEQQALYVQQGKSRTLLSKHVQGLAFDLALFVNGEYQITLAAYRPLGEYWEALAPSCIWGGRWPRFPDGVHFEYDPESSTG
jgi:hypothetical protein